MESQTVNMSGEMKIFTLPKKLYRYFREEGSGGFLTRALNDILSPIYKSKKVIFYKNENTANEIGKNSNGRREQIKVRMALPEDIDELEQIMYQDRFEIKKRFKRGNRCFVACIGTRIVHYTWVSFYKEYLPSINKWIELAEDEAYVYNVRTLSDFRGQGIFPFVLASICGQLRKDGYKRILASIQSDNIPSQKAFEKAGFKKTQEISFLRILGLKKYRYNDLTNQE